MDLLNVLATTCTYLPEVVEPIASTARTIVTLIKIVVPVLLIVWGMLDLGKAVMAQKEDEIKKGQQTFVKRLIAAAIVFFIVTVVGLVLRLVNVGNEWDCARCFIDTECTFEYDNSAGNEVEGE